LLWNVLNNESLDIDSFIFHHNLTMITFRVANFQNCNVIIEGRHLLLLLMVFSVNLISCTESTFQLSENYKYRQFLSVGDSTINDEYYNDGMVKDKIFRGLTDDFSINPVVQDGSTLEIRVWMHYSMSGYPKVLIFRNKDSLWFAEKHIITKADFVEGKAYPTAIVRKKLSAPQSGWQNFMDRLLGFDILTIPEHKKKISTVTDGELFYFEVLTPTVKHFYLRSGEYYAGHDNEDYKIWAMLKLIENEFGFKWLDYSGSN
jgi:hypothetical protein